MELLYKIIPLCDKVLLDTREGLYYWNDREDSVTKTQYSEDWKKEIQITEEIISFCEDNYKNIKKFAIKRYVKVSIKCMYKCIDANKLNEGKKIAKSIRKYAWMYCTCTNEKIHLKISLILSSLNFNIFRIIYILKRGGI